MEAYDGGFFWPGAILNTPWEAKIGPSEFDAHHLDSELGKYVDKYWWIRQRLLLLPSACSRNTHAPFCRRSTKLLGRYHVKPSACWEWTPSLYRRECLEGLAKYWGLTASPFGQLEGAEEKLRDFYSFLNSLTFSCNVERKYVV
jgi:hypothetical protein